MDCSALGWLKLFEIHMGYIVFLLFSLRDFFNAYSPTRPLIEYVLPLFFVITLLDGAEI